MADIDMSRPPLTTILLDGVPTKQGEWLMGLDMSFFNANDKLKGIKGIPDGYHLFHYSSPNDTEEALTSAVRNGFWFDCKEGDVIVISWDPQLERFARIDDVDTEQLNCTKALSTLGESYSFMINYIDDSNVWQDKLISYVDEDIIEMIPKDMNTIVASRQENDILRDALTKGINKKEQETPTLSKSLSDLSLQPQINYTPINFKINKEGDSNVQDITANYLDKTWYFNSIYSDSELFLGEFQISFINYIVFGNYCSMVQWLQMLRLLSMCESLINTSKSLCFNFLEVLTSQLEKLPREYLVDDTQMQCSLDLKHYTESMENYLAIFGTWDWNSGCCGKLKMQGLIIERWKKIIQLHKDNFGLDLMALQNENELDEDDGPVIVTT
ncbi:A1 cistron-splicing factor Aar2p [[Candida] anglica]|uniref:A1 cistron-splicing factor Aar2p n=1 Tax=[Candida] anglica TaxID=148631 RepID=A0ABP0EEU5_9ASCO